MEKIWQLLPVVDGGFLKEYPQYNRTVSQLLYNRGLKKEEEIELFLCPEYPKHSSSPLLFSQMDEAADLVIRHIKNEDKIVVYGDYDADGVTASALLFDVFSILKAKTEVYIPHRATEGYGLNEKSIKEIARSGVKLVITVDTGIRDKEKVEYARELGLSIIVTDHHFPPEEKNDYPGCLVINPAIPDEKYPYKYLAGVGVAFKLAEAIIEKSTLEDSVKSKLKERCLDLVAIGTVADCVDLNGENRVLVKSGLEVLNKKNRLGIRELVLAAGIGDRVLESWNIGFQIAPRLNAAGRMEHANTAFELLTTSSLEEAKKLAQDLGEKNNSRQKVTGEMVEETENELLPDIKADDRIIIVVSPSVTRGEKELWSEGVVGLVSGKISDKYYLPSLVIIQAEKEGFVKGSGRSIDEFNIIKALEECEELLENFGGHPRACGFTLKKDNLELFKSKMIKIAKRELGGKKLSPRIVIEAEVGLEEVDEKLARDVRQFAPFGSGNEEPKFLTKNLQIADILLMGAENQHIKFRLNGQNAGIKTAIGFGQAGRWKDLEIGQRIDMIYFLELNRFNGREEVQLKIVDIKQVTNNKEQRA